MIILLFVSVNSLAQRKAVVYGNYLLDRLVGQMAKKEGVTEQLKSDDWLCRLQKMNSIRSRAEEVVLNDLIYSL